MGQTTTMAEETRQGSNRVAAQEEKSWNEPVLGLALPIFIVGSCPGPATGQYGLWAIIAECGSGKTGPHSYYLGLDLLWDGDYCRPARWVVQSNANASTNLRNWATFSNWLSFLSPIWSNFATFKFYVLEFV
jgi:hypothetical protein